MLRLSAPNPAKRHALNPGNYYDANMASNPVKSAQTCCCQYHGTRRSLCAIPRILNSTISAINGEVEAC